MTISHLRQMASQKKDFGGIKTNAYGILWVPGPIEGLIIKIM